MSDGQGGRRMRGRTGVTVALTVMAILALLLVGGVYLRMQSVGQRLSERNLRELARIGRGIEGQVNNLQTVLTNLSQRDTADIERAGRLVPGLGDITASVEIRSRDEMRDAGPFPSTTMEAAPGEILALVNQAIVDGTAADDSVVVVTTRTRWSMAPLTGLLASEYFSAVLIANAAGRVVLAPPESSGLRVRDLSDLEFRPDSASDAASALATPSASDIKSVVIAGRAFRLFRQPLDLVPLDVSGEEGGETRWVIAGLVPELEFRRDSMALGPGSALSIGLLMVFGVLAAPFVAVASLGPRERLRARQLIYLSVSLIIACGLAGLRLADLTHFGNLQADLYAGADSVADLLAGNLLTEAHVAVEELQRHTRALEDSIEAARGRETTPLVAWGTAGFKEETGIDLGEPPRYPVFQSVFWTNSRGIQEAKWTPRAANTPLVDVGARSYFREVRAGRGWPGRGSSGRTELPAGPDTTFYMESIRSITTGEHLAVFAVPFEWPTTAVASPGIAAVVSRLVSLDAPVLPPGIEFAVVDAAGRTLFHNRSERNLEENFIDETGGDRRVESILAARAERAVDALYRERRSRLFIRPLPNTPLSLVVVMDKAPLETARFEAWFIGGALFLAFAFVIFVWFAMVEAIVRSRVHWLWPDLEQPAKHVAAGAIFVVLLAGLVAQAMMAGTTPPHPSSYLVPFQALGLGLVALSVHGRASRSLSRAELLGWSLTAVATLLLVAAHVRVGAEPVLLAIQLVAVAAAAHIARVTFRRAGTFRPGPARIRYEGSLVLGLMVVAVMPGYLLYQMVFSDHLELVVRHHQTQISERLWEREVRLTGLSEGRDAAAAAWVRSSKLDLAFEPVFRTEFSPSSDRCSGEGDTPGRGHYDVHERIGDLVPWLTEASVQMRQLLAPQVDRCWSMARAIDRSDDGAENAPDSLVLTDARFRIASAIPGNVGTPTWGSVLLLVGVIGLVVSILRWLAFRVFLIELGDPRPLTLHEAIPESIDRSIVFVCLRSTDRAPLRERARRGDLVYVDLMDVETDEGGRPMLPAMEASVVCLDHFDHRVHEPTWSDGLLTHLERSMYVHGARVLLLTSQEPDDLFPAVIGGPDPLEGVDQARWSRLLGQFAKVSVADDVSSSTLEERLASSFETRCERAGPDPLGRRRCETLDRTLVQECGRSVRLHEVALQVAASPVYAQVDAEELYELILEGAAPFYAALWAVLGDEEKLVVAQLAAGAVVNPKCLRSVRRLFARGIVIREPELKLMNRTFAQFVRDTVPVDTVEEWERGGAPSTWSQVRFPLSIVWVALALFLFWTQRSLVGDAAAFLGTAGVGLAAIVRLLTLMEKGSDKAAP